MVEKDTLSKIDISILKRKRSFLNESWHGERVNENFSRLYYIRKGTGFIESCGRRSTLRKGHLYVVPPKGDFSYGCGGSLEIWWVHFTATLLAGISIFDYLSHEIEFAPDDRNAVETKMARLIDCHEQESICSTVQCNGVLLDLISVFLHPESCSIKSTYHRKVERFLPVLKHINGNLARKITVDELAGIANYERSHFAVAFKTLFGVSPVHYVNRQRVEAVLLSLHTGEGDKLEALAERYGFCDAYHLSKMVKKHTGMSPREHMHKIRDNLP